MKQENEFGEDFIEFETAKLARNKGFAWRQGFLSPGKITYVDGVIPDSGYNRCYNEEKQVIYPKLFNYRNPHYACPTQAVLAKWLRKLHNIHISIEVGHDEDNIWYDAYLYKIEKSYNYDPIIVDDLTADTHEKAFELGLAQALNLLP